MSRNNGLKTFGVVAAVLLLLSWLRLDPGSTVGAGAGESAGPADKELAGTPDETADPTLSTSDPTAPRTPGAAKTAAGPSSGKFECAKGKNGGATDTGVTDSKIRLATTAVLDGPAKSLLEDSPVAMKAVIDKVNKAGGVCGRLLDLRVVNDSFDSSRGQTAIKNFIAEGVFALPVVPSAEGLGAAILSGEIAKAKIPVVGTDGLRREQYSDDYVWPVASATVTAMRVMVKYGATNRNAKSFALVWDEKYKFGKEGKDAFVEQVKALGFKDDALTTVPLNPDDPSYGTKINNEFAPRCGAVGSEKCDMVALLLLPETAKKWLQGNPALGKIYSAGAQTLFTDRFAQDCVQQINNRCQGFAVWTGYNPPIGPLASLPSVSTYVNDVKSVKSTIDVNNQFVEGAYLGMNAFVEALKRTGGELTRERLRGVLDSMTFQSDLSSALTWKPKDHAANVRSQSFAMAVSQGTFRGWANEGTGFLLDPAHGG